MFGTYTRVSVPAGTLKRLAKEVAFAILPGRLGGGPMTVDESAAEQRKDRRQREAIIAAVLALDDVEPDPDREGRT